jgi:hypothetical protein
VTTAPAAHGEPARTVVVQGRIVALPVVVRDAVAITAMFLVPTQTVRRLLPHAALHPLEPWPGRSVCVLAGVEYRDNDLGRYNEIAVSFLVRPGATPPRPVVGLLPAMRRREAVAYIHRLPVTTSFSRDAGRDIWGFPKTVDRIEFQDAGGRRTGSLIVDGEHVLTLSVARRGRRTIPEMPQDAVAVRDGVVWRTPSTMGGDGVGFRLGGARVSLGSHPWANELRTLGLPKRALCSSSMERMHARFEAPERLAL